MSGLSDKAAIVGIGATDFMDVAARRDGATIFAEAKGRTAAPGLDVDTRTAGLSCTG